MKKKIRLNKWIIVMLALLTFAFSMFLLRNVIASYIIRSVVFHQSEGRIVLHISEIVFNPFRGTVKLIGPDIQFTNSFLNEAKTIKLKRVNLQEIMINGISIADVFINSQIKAKYLFIEKPVIWFEEEEGKEISSFDPAKLMESLNRKPEDLSKLKVFIDDIEISYGSINMTSGIASKFQPGFVDFRLILHNFSTKLPADTSIKKILYSDDFIFKIKDLQKVFPSGYQLTIDSAMFSSSNKRFSWNGVNLYAIQKDTTRKHGIKLHAGSLYLNDIDIKQINKLEDLKLRSIIISNGYLFNYDDPLIDQKKDTLHSKGKQELFTIFHGIELDSLFINKFSYARVEDNFDTTFLTRDLFLIVNGIKIDSSMTRNPWRDLIFSEIELRAAKAFALKAFQNTDISFSEISFSSLEEKFELKNLRIIDNNQVRGRKAFDVSANDIVIEKFSLDKLRHGEKQNVVMLLDSPDISVNALPPAEKHKEVKKENPFGALFGFENFSITKGNFYFDNDSILSIVRGLNFSASDIEISNQTFQKISYNKIALNLTSLLFNSTRLKDQIETGNLSYNDNNLIISDFKTSIITGKQNKSANLYLQNVNFTNLNIEKFFSEKLLSSNEIRFESPVIKGKIDLTRKKDSVDIQDSAKKQILPFSIEMDKITLVDAKIDLDVLQGDDSMHVQSDIDFEIFDINVRETDSTTAWLEQLKWKILFSSTSIESDKFKVVARQLTLDESAEMLKISKLTFLHKSLKNAEPKSFDIKDLSFPELEITGLNYDKYLFYDTLDFQTLILKDPIFKATIKKLNSPAHSLPQKELDLSFLKKIVYDTIEMNRLNLDIEKIDKGHSHSFFNLSDLTIRHDYTNKEDSNLLKGFILDFTRFEFQDTVSNHYSVILGGELNPRLHNFIIRGIKGGYLNEKTKKPDENKGYHYYISRVDFDGISLSNKLPAKLAVDKITIDSLDLFAEVKKQTSNTELAGPNLDIYKKYSKLIYDLHVDTTLLNNIKVNYRQTENDQVISSIDFDNVAVVLNKIKFDSTISSSNLPLDELIINLRGRTFISKDSLYKFHTGNISYNFPKKRITVDSIYLIPLFEDSLFFERAQYQTDRMKIYSEKVEITDFRFDDYIKNKKIHAGRVDVYHVNADMKRDKSYPIRPGTHKNMPQTSLRNMNQIVTIDSIRVFDSYVKYLEHVEKSDVPGEVFFDRFNITAFNFTNDKSVLDSISQFIVNAKAFLMGHSMIDLSVHFNLLSPSDQFWFTAKSETITLSDLNSMTENLMGIAFKEGKGSINIPKISGDTLSSEGEMMFKYKKLKLTLYNRKKAQLHKGPFTPVIDFMMNDLLIKSNNPKFARAPRTGQAYFERDTQKGIINYIFKSALSGMISTLGFNNKEQRQIKKENNTYESEDTQK